MTFSVKMDDKKIQVDLECTNLKDTLIYCKPKERLVLMRKFWLDGNKGIPLQRIGKEYNLTRERIRQIESQALMRFRRLIVGNTTYMEVLDKAKEILEQNGWFLEEKLLISKLVNEKLFKFSKQELLLILVSDFDIIYLKRNRLIDKSFYLDNLYEDILTRIALTVEEYFSKRGKSQETNEFISYMKGLFSKEYSDVAFLNRDDFYINLFNSLRAVTTFDGRVWLLSFSDVNPRTIKLKLVHVLRKMKKPLHYQDIPKRIMEIFPGKNIKVNTVHNELVKNGDIFVNMWLGLYGLKEWWFEGGLVKDIIKRIMKRNDRPMGVKELEKEVLKEKMVSHNTVMINLQKHKDIFERVDKGVYKLRK